MRPIRAFLSIAVVGLSLVAAPSAEAARKTSAPTKKKAAPKAVAGKASRPASAAAVKANNAKAAMDPLGDSGASSTATAATGAPPPSRGPTRLDFDDRLIQGQTNKSGAVYLYDRKELKNRSMVKKRESFRSEIISAVYDGE